MSINSIAVKIVTGLLIFGGIGTAIYFVYKFKDKIFGIRIGTKKTDPIIKQQLEIRKEIEKEERLAEVNLEQERLNKLKEQRLKIQKKTKELNKNLNVTKPQPKAEDILKGIPE